MTSGGLLIAGLVVPVQGVTIHNPLDTKWCRLNPRDYKQRSTKWVRSIMQHTTKGIDPQHLVLGEGPPGKDELVAKFWQNDPTQSAAHIIVDNDGTAACLADLATIQAYHATTINDWSVGIETYQNPGGVLYEAAIATTVRITQAICEHMGIPFQMHGAPYRPGRIVERLKHGGADCVGVFGHRDQAWKFPNQLGATERVIYPDGYANRGRGDPGDLIMLAIRKAGAEPFDFEKREDLSVWMRRQQHLVNIGERLTVDGVAGPGTMAALRRRGLKNGRAVDAALT